MTTFISDLLLLVLMLVGILRWKEARERGSVWWLLYTQVSLCRLAETTLILMKIGTVMGFDYHTCGSSSLGAHSNQSLLYITDGQLLGFHGLESEWYVNLLPFARPCIQQGTPSTVPMDLVCSST
jgi:hypothetical protein